MHQTSRIREQGSVLAPLVEAAMAISAPGR